MKKLFVLMSVSLVLCACNKQKASVDAVDSTTVQTDSLAPGEVPDEQMEANNNYMHPDCILLDLKGEVKEVNITTIYCNEEGVEEAGLRSDGKLIFNDDYSINVNKSNYDAFFSGVKIKRNEVGQIIGTIYEVADFGGAEVQRTFEYNALGQVETYQVDGLEGYTTTTYKYDADGHLSTSRQEGAGEGMVEVTETTYTVEDTDEYGNWTRRSLKIDTKYADDDGKYNYTEQSTTYQKETREIIYK